MGRPRVQRVFSSPSSSQQATGQNDPVPLATPGPSSPATIPPTTQPPPNNGVDSLRTPDERSPDFSTRIVHLALTHSRLLFSGQSTPVEFLAPIRQRYGRPMKLLRQVSLDALPDFFDFQENDFNKKLDLISPAIRVRWFGHPGSAARDWRARSMTIVWNEGVIDAAEREQAQRLDSIVAQCLYVCCGQHNVVPKVGPDSEDAADAHDEGESASGKLSRWHYCAGSADGNVTLLVQVHASDLNMARIYQSGEHPNTNPSKTKLKMSRRIHNLIEEQFSRGGGCVTAKATEVMVLLSSICMKNNLDFPMPWFRRPERQHILSMYPAARHREQLDRNPLFALDMLIKKLGENAYFYNSILPGTSANKRIFSCAFKDDFTIDSLIMHSRERGVGLDSCWRNKNENRAPLTLLVAVDENQHLLPGSAMMSAKVRKETLAAYLRETKAQVETRAKKILDDHAQGKTSIDISSYHSEDEFKRLLEEAQAICDSKDGWTPAFLMTDKCRPQIDALALVFPNVPIRICQFHVVQAWLRWDCDDPKKKKRAPGFCRAQKYQILMALRLLQRCRTLGEMREHCENFLERLRRITYKLPLDFEVDAQDEEEFENMVGGGNDDAGEEEEEEEEEEEGQESTKRSEGKVSNPPDDPHGEGSGWDGDREVAASMLGGSPKQAEDKQWEFLHEYAVKNWLTTYWFPLFTDVGLPKDQTRDGTWNTNNHTERAFRVIDQVFLDMRRNKRIDRMAMILVYEFFPYYRYWRDRKLSKSSLERIKIIEAGHRLWESGAVESLGPRKFRIWTTRKVEEIHLSAVQDDGDPRDLKDADLVGDSQVCRTVDFETVGARCPCARHMITGKMCSHMHAARLQMEAGSVAEFEEHETRAAQEGPKVERTPGSMRTDKAFDLEFHRVLDILEKQKAPVIRLTANQKAAKEKAARERNENPPKGSKRRRQSGDDDDDDDDSGFTGVLGFKTNRSKKRRVQALHSGRTGPKNQAKTKTQPKPRPKLGARDVPVFNRKPGPPAMKKMPNSTMPVGSRTKHFMVPATTSGLEMRKRGEPAVVSSVSSQRSQEAYAEGLNQEEAHLGTADCTRWDDPSFMLLADEMIPFIDMFNQLSYSLERDVLFIHQWSGFIKMLKRVDWSSPTGDVDRGEEMIASLLHTVDTSDWDSTYTSQLVKAYRLHQIRPFKYIVFADLRGLHWTIAIHNLQAERGQASFRMINSLSSPVNYDISHQLCIQEFFRLDRASSMPSLEPCTNYDTTALGVQADDLSCGFWAAFFCLGWLFGMSVDSPAFRSTSIKTVKEKLSVLYIQYFTSPDGISLAILESTMQDYGLGPLLSERSDLGNKVLAASGDRTRHAPEHADFVKYKALNRFADTFLNSVGTTAPFVCDGVSLDYGAFAACITDEENLHPNLFTAAAHFLLHPEAKGQGPLQTRRETRHGTTIVTSLSFGTEVLNAAIQRKEALTPPLGGPWFEDDIFSDAAVHRILMPFFKLRDGKHSWDIVEVDMIDHRVEVYTPCKDENWSKRLHTRVIKLLRHEHQERGSETDFEATWNLLRVKGTEDDLWCAACPYAQDSGFYVFEALRLLVLGVPPLQSNWNHTGYARQLQRLQPICYVGRALRTDRSENDAFTPWLPAHLQPPSDHGTIQNPILVDDFPELPTTRIKRVGEILRGSTSWLSGECIASWSAWMMGSTSEARPPNWIIAETYFYNRLWSPNGRQEASGWYRDVDLSTVTRLLLPIHSAERRHWSLVSIEFGQKRIEYYDSLPEDDSEDAVIFQRIVDFLSMRPELASTFPLGWEPCLIRPQNVPIQGPNDTYNCGIYTCAFIEELANGRRPCGAFTFTEADATRYRTKMLDILTQEKGTASIASSAGSRRPSTANSQSCSSLDPTGPLPPSNSRTPCAELPRTTTSELVQCPVSGDVQGIIPGPPVEDVQRKSPSGFGPSKFQDGSTAPETSPKSAEPFAGPNTQSAENNASPDPVGYVALPRSGPQPPSTAVSNPLPVPAPRKEEAQASSSAIPENSVPSTELRGSTPAPASRPPKPARRNSKRKLLGTDGLSENSVLPESSKRRRAVSKHAQEAGLGGSASLR